MRLVGMVSHNAALAELAMFEAFVLLSGCTPEVAEAIFYTLDSVPAKATMLRRVVSRVGGPTEMRALVDKILKGVDTSNQQRQFLAHALLVPKAELPEGPFHLHRPRAGESTPLTAQRMTELRVAAVEGARTALNSYLELCKARRVRPSLGPLDEFLA